ncbi:MAG: methionine gamma-lyase family protein, partial [Clostridia bacterium]|nr:methionine gamma-lyase family protein [Clostridia bacterium]
SLTEMGVICRVLDVDFNRIDCGYIVAALGPKTKMVEIQRSRGYSLRPSLSVTQIGQIVRSIKQARPDVIVFCDNCYGEFVEELEPTDVGVDLMAGSLIKNPGAGLAPGGGYVCGKEELVERAAVKLTVPGAGRELGASLTDNRQFYQALLMAPQIVLEAILGNVFTASLLDHLGFQTLPDALEKRADIIQTINLENKERLCAYVQGIQKYSPVDSYVAPEPSPMPGYDSDIIMASGGFVAGSSIELSADAPLRSPFAVFQQGGTSRYEVIYAVTQTLRDMKEMCLI